MPTKNQPPGSLSVSPLLSVTMLLIGALLQADRLLLNDNLAAFFQSAPAATVTLESSLGWCGKAECPVVPNNNNQATPEYREDSIYARESAFDVQRRVTFPTDGLDDNAHVEYRRTINELFAAHRPSDHSFFAALAAAPTAVATNGGILREMYTRYQAAMHATRVAIYFMPGMNTPKQRQTKVKIILDDDSPDIETHHKQLENLFTSLGATAVPQMNDFGDLEDVLADIVTDDNTARFVTFADKNYRDGLGGWTLFEVMSDDWISALAKAFEPHFEGKRDWLYGLQYFDEIATGHVEIEHMLQSLALTEELIKRHPDRADKQIELANEMALEIDGLWANLQGLISEPAQLAKYADPPLKAVVEL